MAKPSVHSMPFARVYPLDIQRDGLVQRASR